MDEVAGVAVVPLIVGLVAVARRLGLPTRRAPALAVGLGLLVSLSLWASAGGESSTGVLAAWRGVSLGLAAVGLYAAARQQRAAR